MNQNHRSSLALFVLSTFFAASSGCTPQILIGSEDDNSGGGEIGCGGSGPGEATGGASTGVPEGGWSATGGASTGEPMGGWSATGGGAATGGAGGWGGSGGAATGGAGGWGGSGGAATGGAGGWGGSGGAATGGAGGWGGSGGAATGGAGGWGGSGGAATGGAGGWGGSGGAATGGAGGSPGTGGEGGAAMIPCGTCAEVITLPDELVTCSPESNALHEALTGCACSGTCGAVCAGNWCVGLPATSACDSCLTAAGGCATQLAACLADL